jgi:zinc transporter ZupT
MDTMIENIINVVDQSGDVNVATRLSEELAENIDKECHILQYKLDHCRRLLQGSFSDLGNNITVDKWKDIDSRNELRKRLYNLSFIAKHLIEHMDDSNLNAAILREVHSHMHDMDHQIEKFHNTVEITAFKWKKKELPIPEKGSTVPASLIIPVCIDSIIDGFVIGLTTAISFRAGLILGIATSMEMGFLGIAVSVRIKRCTSSSLIVRYASIVFPPLFVVIFSVIGSIIGNLSKSQSFYFIAFVSLGIYCLLNLVFDELLVEARNGFHDVPWHLKSMIFLGLFVVITLNTF